MNIYLPAPIGNHVALDKASLHHLRVRRMQNHDSLQIIDGQGRRYRGELLLDKVASIINIETLGQDPIERPLELVIGIPKLSTLDSILQQAVELGVTHIYPLISEYTPVKHQLLRQKQQSNHWQKILIQAMMQSGRAWLPKLAPIGKIGEISWPPCTILHPYAEKPLVNKDFANSQTVAIGPEGGWSERDLDQLNPACQLRKLNMPIMRSETAIVAALALMQMGRQDAKP